MTIIEHHIKNAINWRERMSLSLTKDRSESISVLIDEYLKLKTENEALRDVLTKAASIGLAHGIGVAITEAA